MQLEKKFHKQNLKCKYTHLSYNDYLYFYFIRNFWLKSMTSLVFHQSSLLPKVITKGLFIRR